jgi:hypothetical protein
LYLPPYPTFASSPPPQHIRFNLASFSANRWLSVRLEILGGILVLGAALFLVVDRSALQGNAAGLQLSYALQITGLLNMIVRDIYI